MAQLRQVLKTAREQLDRKEFEAALASAREAMALDKSCYMAYLYAGKCNTELGEFKRAEQAFRKATQLDAANLFAWQGLSQLFQKTGDNAQLVGIYEELIKLLSEDKHKKQKRNNIQALARTHAALGDIQQAIETYKRAFELTADLADQVSVWKLIVNLLLSHQATQTTSAAAKTERQLEKVYKTIIALHAPNTTEYYVKYIEILQSRLQATPDADTQQALRKEIKALCSEALSRQPTHYLPYELILEFSEEDNSEVSQQDVKRLGAQLVHSFPHRGLSWIILGHIISLKYHAKATQQSAMKEDKELSMIWDDSVALLEAGLAQHPTYITGWIYLAQLQRSKQASNATIDCTRKGLTALAGRVAKSSCVSVAALKTQLLLLMGEAYHKTKRLKEGEEIYRRVLALQSTNATALTGLGRIAFDQKDFKKSAEFYEQVLSLSPNSDEALAMIGQIQYLQGQFQEAANRFLAAIKLNPNVAQYYYDLGRAYWHLGGVHKTDKQYAQTQFLLSAKLLPNFAGNFTYLGHYYHVVDNDVARAKRCYQKALELNPAEDDAGIALSTMYTSAGQQSLAVSLWTEITGRNSRAGWAWKGHSNDILRLGKHEFDMGKYEQAITCLQSALRIQPSDAASWKNLADAYSKQGKFMAALKAFVKVLELDSKNVASRYQVASIKLMVGMREEAVLEYQELINQLPDYLPALKGMGETCIGLANEYRGTGLTGRAGDMLERAVTALTKATSIQSNLQCLWKLLGDAHTLHYHLPALSTSAESKAWDMETVKGAKDNVMQHLETGARAYQKVMEIDPASAHARFDLAVNIYYRSRLLVAHMPVMAGADTASRKLLEEAEQQLRVAIELDRTKPEFWNALGVVTNALSPSLSQHTFITALNIDETNAQAWTNLGLLYLTHGHFRLAEKAFMNAHTLDPDFGLPWLGKAIMNEAAAQPEAITDSIDEIKEKEDFQASLALYSHACFVGNNLAEANLGLGMTSYINGNTDDALGALSRLIASCPFDSLNAIGAWHALGLAQHRAGLSRAAESSYARALQLLRVEAVCEKDRNKDAPKQEDKPKAFFGQTLQYILGSTDPDAAPFTTAPLTLQEKFEAVSFDRAVNIAALGRHEDAVNLLSKVVQSASTQKTTQAQQRLDIAELQLANAYSNQGKSAEGLKHLQAVVDRNKQGTSAREIAICREAFLNMAKVAYRGNTIDAAKKALMQCVTKEPGCIAAWRMMGGLGLMIADYNATNTALTQLTKLCGASAHTFIMFAYMHTLKGEHSVASAYMSKALHLSPADETVRTLFGQFYLTTSQVSAVALNTTVLNAEPVPTKVWQDRMRLIAESWANMGKAPHLTVRQSLQMASSAAQQLIRIDPLDTDAWYLLATVSYAVALLPSASPNSDKWDALSNLLQTLLAQTTEKKQQPSNKRRDAEVIVSLQLMLSDTLLQVSPSQEDRALALAKEALGTAQKDPALSSYTALATRQLARHAIACKEYKEGVQLYKQSARLAPQEGFIWHELAEVYLNLGSDAAAEACYQHVIKLADNYKGNDDDEVKQLLIEARFAANLRLAHMYTQRGNVKDAHHAAKAAIREHSDSHAVASLTQGLACVMTQEWRKGRAKMQKALQSYPMIPLARFYLAGCTERAAGASGLDSAGTETCKQLVREEVALYPYAPAVAKLREYPQESTPPADSKEKEKEKQ